MVFLEHLKSILADCLQVELESRTINTIISKYPTIHTFVNISNDEPIARVIGKKKYKQIAAIINLAKAINNYGERMQQYIRTPFDVTCILREEMEYLQKEVFKVIALSTRNSVLFTETISIGSLNACAVHPRDVFRTLVKVGANACVVAHNHPSGDPAPSSDDIQLTQNLIEAGKILGISVLDHVIIGLGGRYESFKEKGII